MKSELNNYRINNPDGSSGARYSEQKMSFSNDNPRFIEEDSLSGQGEFVQTPETFDDRKKKSASKKSSSRKDSGSGSENGSSSSNSSSSSGGSGSENISSSASSSASSAASTASSAASAAASSAASAAVGSSIGAIAGSIAATVATAAMVVAVFVSTLVINLTLVMAGMTSLVLQVEMRGAQEEDFVTPIIAILEGEDGVRQEQEIQQDTVYITFTDLEPGKEYTVRIKNEEKTFVEKSFFTATEEVQKGSVESWSEKDEVFVSVQGISLKSGEYYTVTVKNAQGKAVFAKDDMEPSKEFRFAVPEAGVYSVTVSVNGKAYAISQFEIQKAPDPNSQPDYDFANPTWNWTDDYGSASVIFVDRKGGDPLSVPATISSEITAPMCSTDGKAVYTAVVEYNGQSYSQEQEKVLPATGHAYELDSFVWGQDLDIAYAKYVCQNNTNHYQMYPATITVSATDPTCESEGVTTYTATYEGETDTKVVTIGATGHDYQSVEANADNNGLAAHYECPMCHKLFVDGDEGKVETTAEALEMGMGEAWTETTSLPTVEGNYYLTGDVTLSETWTVPEGTVNLDLHGHGIIQTGNCTVLYVGKGVVLNIYDSGTLVEHRFYLDEEDPNAVAGLAVVDDALTGEDDYQTFTGGYITGGYNGNNSGDVYAPAIDVYGGVVNMYGGVLIGNESNGHCGAVHVHDAGQFTMVDGRIIYNKCLYAGAAIFARGNGTLILTGGEIAYNRSIGHNVAGVATDGSAELYMSGNPWIHDNSGFGDSDDLLLETRIVLNSALTNTHKIPVKMYIDGSTGIFTEGWSEFMGDADPNDYFISSEGYSIRLTDGEVELYENTNGGSNEPESGATLNISDGNIRIYSNGYTIGDSDFVSFESSADNPYVITGSREDDTPLRIDTRTNAGSSSGSQTYYLTLDNVTISGNSWATAFVVHPYSPVDIYINNVGMSHINPYYHVALETQEGSATVNIYITSDNGFDGFDFADQYDAYGLFDPNANIHVYMNGVEVDENGNPKS